MKMMRILAILFGLPAFIQADFPKSCPDLALSSSNSTYGVCPQDFGTIGGHIEAVHESTHPPTGLAVDNELNIYLTYPRNLENSTNTFVIATSFNDEEPWPSKEMQWCQPVQDPSTCFVNIQNAVLDSIGQLWVQDSGIPNGKTQAVTGGAKLMAFNTTTRKLIKTVVVPDSILANGTNLDDLRINNTAGTAGFAFLTDQVSRGGILAIDLATGESRMRLADTHFVKADKNYVGTAGGEPVYCWKGTKKTFCDIASNGIALQSGNVYWGILASRRFYYVSQAILQDFNATDAEVFAAVQDPGELGTEQAGFTADNQGRLFMMASEPNAIFYVQTNQSFVTQEINGVPAGGSGPVKVENYYVKTFLRNGLLQHADTAAIGKDGYMYFSVNQLGLAPSRRYNNVDARKGPYRSYKVYIGAGPAV